METTQEREERQRDPELLKEARYLRGVLYLKLGKHAMGNRDLSAVYARDPTYRDVAQLLIACGWSLEAARLRVGG